MKLFTKHTEQAKMNSKKVFLSAFLLGMGFISCLKPDAAFGNNLRTMFQNNSAYIYTINVRTFGAQDYNKNDIIEPELGEVKGTFINAIPKLKLLKESGVNTVYLLPVTKVGKLHALGTAGSLYALDSFDTINPQLFDSTDLETDIKKQAQKFVSEAHKLNMHVIVDLPACGSYDLSLEKPELFLKNAKGETVIPSDWTDVRIFDPYNPNTKELNKSLVNEHKKFINLVKEINADGIRADVAAIKPYEFWKEIIEYARRDDPEFLFIAEAAPAWDNPTKGKLEYLTVNALLDAGFDGFYADWSNLSEIKTNTEFFKKLNTDLKILEKYNGKKSLMAAFATHDQKSPALLGYEYWNMVNWLNVLLPVNPYTLDGFPAGDGYDYQFIGKTSKTSETDNDNYSIEKGSFDIKNFSRAPYPPNTTFAQTDYKDAMKFRYMMASILTTKEIAELETNNSSVFAFKKQKGEDIVLVCGNLNKNSKEEADIKVHGIDKNTFLMPFKMGESPETKKGKMTVYLKPYEIQVFIIKDGFKKKKKKA